MKCFSISREKATHIEHNQPSICVLAFFRIIEFISKKFMFHFSKACIIFDEPCNNRSLEDIQIHTLITDRLALLVTTVHMRAYKFTLS